MTDHIPELTLQAILAALSEKLNGSPEDMMTEALAYFRHAIETGKRAPVLGAFPPPNDSFSMNPPPISAAKSERDSVTIYFKYGQEDWAPFFEFEKVIENAIAKAAVGDYDGNLLAVGGRDGNMYLYGPSADALFEVVKPHLLGAEFLKGIEVTLCYGQVTDPRRRESIIRLTPWPPDPVISGV